MIEFNLTILIAGVIAGAAPIVLATIGETITEKAGIINLSLDGTILLGAMVGFVVAFQTGSLVLAFLAAGGVGAVVAAIVGVFSLKLGQSQVAVGFVLTLMTRDLAYFLGNAYSRLQGRTVSPVSIPLLKEIPFLGPILFSQNLPVYFSMVMVLLAWWYIYQTPAGLALRAVGEHPEASFARGSNPFRLQMLYTVCGGFLVGLAGATFSLATKPGWGRPQGAEGTGWIALALVIFGGWNPVKAALGAYLFSFLQVMGIYFQGWFPSIPAQVFQVAPFPLMIFSLILMHAGEKEDVSGWEREKGRLRRLVRFFSGTAPSALGKPLERE
jgi:ABC-type uncharacterized transport system permease subunit